MIVLAFDTCFDACSVAVGRAAATAGASWAETEILAHERQAMRTGHAEVLVPMIGRALDAAGIGAADIGRIGVTYGPGTFTGTRITVAAARALSLALGAPVVGISSLRAVGYAAARRVPDFQHRFDAVLVARDARRGEHYVELVDGSGETLAGPRVATAAEAAVLGQGLRLVVTGTAAALVSAAGAEAGLDLAIADSCETTALANEPDAADVLALALRTVPTGAPVEPLYLRPPDAKPPADPAVRRAAETGR